MEEIRGFDEENFFKNVETSQETSGEDQDVSVNVHMRRHLHVTTEAGKDKLENI